jgi:2-oxoglutarate dehydrogenase E1 component
MATSTQNTAQSGGSAEIIENVERERVFELFRQWGYLEAELDPLGLLPPQPHPDLQIDNEWAQEARRIYRGTVGAEFMHIADPGRRHWIQDV